MTLAMLGVLAVHMPLSAAQQRGLIGVVRDLRADLLVEFAGRGDLHDDVRRQVVTAAPAHLVLPVLRRMPADQTLAETAADTHGVSPDLVVWCGHNGWFDLAADLAAELGARDAESVVDAWAAAMEDAVPAAVRLALVVAVLTDVGPPLELSDKPDREKKRLLELMRRRRKVRQGRLWRLMAPAPELWLRLANDEKHATVVREVLLDKAESLPDDVLLACLPLLTADDLRDRDDEISTIVRLDLAADVVRRWPRLRELAPSEVTRVAREAVEDGWSPDISGYFGPDWLGLAAFAELSDDPATLAVAVAALNASNPWEKAPTDSESSRDWLAKSTSAAVALAVNPYTPQEAFAEVIPSLDEAALQQVLPHLSGAPQEAARTRLTEPALVAVPDDETLSALADPAEELRKHLRYLRGRVSQRYATCQGLLRSRFTPADVLLALPAKSALHSTEKAERVAALILEECGNVSARWAALPGSCRHPTGTLSAWLDRLRTAS